jgi:hypothetical protein
MKTNTIQIITNVAAAAIAGFGITNIAGDFAVGVAVAVGYLAVAALVALTAADYRRQRTYNA